MRWPSHSLRWTRFVRTQIDLSDDDDDDDDNDDDVVCVCVSEAPSGGWWRKRRRNDVSDLLRSKGLFYL